MTLSPLLLLALLVLPGVLLCVFSVRHLRHRRVIRGGLHGVSGLALLALAGLGVAVLFNVYSYQRLTHERPVAELDFQALGPQQYRAYLTVPDSPRPAIPRSFVLRGDEWQLDARVLKWQGPAVLLGADTGYRLERLSGRYHRIAQARQGPYTVYRLGTDPGLDLWALARRHPHWLPWLDALYGSATYLPMADGARYAVSVGQGGLVARPLNAAAQQAVAAWK